LGIAGILSATALSCSEGFDPFNSVDRFRILSLKADPPALAEGEVAEVTPLIHTDDDSPVSYKWSWCPFAHTTANGGGCLIDEETLQDILTTGAEAQLGDEAVDALGDVQLSFDLGTEPTAQFPYAIPADLLSSLCRQIISDDTADLSIVPDCDSYFNAVIRLEVTQRDTTLLATKEIPLFINPEDADNTNPEVTDVVILDDDGPVTGPLTRGKWYDLVAEIPDNAAQPVPVSSDEGEVPVDELLFMTWYVTGGETDSIRTSYIEDEVPFETLKNNRWQIPNETDHPDDVITLSLVLQDERGGIGWLSRELELEEEAP
jgi:hypothetical protein